MTPFTGRAIGLAFAMLWLFAGAGALAMPWHAIVAAAGSLAIILLTIHAWRMHERRTGGFKMRRHGAAVIAELVALALAQWLLHRWRLNGYLLPVVGMIVGAHFVGLWWAGGGRSYLWLAASMTLIDAAAMLPAPDSAAMQAIAGLGSALALAAFAGTRLGSRR